MMVNKLIGVGAVLAWMGAAVLAVIPLPTARPFVLALVLAASLTIPVLTSRLVVPQVVRAARDRVHAYMAGWIDCRKAGGSPDGGTELGRGDQKPARNLRAL